MREITLHGMRFHALVGIVAARAHDTPAHRDRSARAVGRRRGSSGLSRAVPHRRATRSRPATSTFSKRSATASPGACFAEHGRVRVRARSPFASRMSPRRPARLRRGRHRALGGCVTSPTSRSARTSATDTRISRERERRSARFPAVESSASRRSRKPRRSARSPQGPFLNQMLAVETTLSPRASAARAAGDRDAARAARATCGGARERSTSTSSAFDQSNGERDRLARAAPRDCQPRFLAA